jgi:two-component system, LytTR family, sensor histidine kinase AlgZ
MSIKPLLKPKADDGASIETLFRAPGIISMILIGEGLALVLCLSPGVQGDRWVFFGLASLTVQWIVLLTLGLLFIMRNALRRMNLNRAAWITLGCLLTSTAAVAMGAWWLMPSNLPQGEIGLAPFVLKLLAIALAVGLLCIVILQHYWQARALAVIAKQAELEALTARIRPHFLFNTLNAGASLVRSKPDQAERVLLNLADLFRAALNVQKEILLEEEINLVRSYLEIESLRFGQRLNIQWQIPEQLPKLLVPSLSIQPLVENAIHHGIEPSQTHMTLLIKISDEQKQWRIEVINDLPGTSVSSSKGHHVGLNSTRERLRTLSSGAAELETSRSDKQFIAAVILQN